MTDKGKRILFLVPYPPDKAPSQRFRFEQYLPLLRENGYSFRVSSYFNEETWRILYRRGHLLQKALGLFLGFMRRMNDLLMLGRYDIIFIHRESSPVGFPLIPYLLHRFSQKRVIFDFDDAIWIPNSSRGNRLFRFLKNPGNSLRLMRWSTVNSCGNEWLRHKALSLNADSRYIPTTIDTENVHRMIARPRLSGKFVIGWTGSHSTVDYLELILPVLRGFEQHHDIEFRVISDRPPGFTLQCLHYLPWTKETEVEYLAGIDVGIMPLPDDEWAKGKCGLKALQYMALGIPVLLSPVGVNPDIVRNGEHGFLCSGPDDWQRCIELLYNDRELLRKMASNTRRHVEAHYSVQSNAREFLLLFA